jgi:hypothetical protein
MTNDTVVVGTTIPAYVMNKPDAWGSWLRNAEAMVEAHPSTSFFAALEVDGRGLEPFRPLLDRFDDLTAAGVRAERFVFMLDDGATEITTANRLRRITMGQNLTSDYCRSVGAQWLLFMAADCAPPPDAVPELLKLQHPLVGGHVGTYCLDGPVVSRYVGEYGNDIREHMATAAFVMLHRSVFNRIGWRWDLDTGESDDPCLHRDAQELLGIPTYVHHGVEGHHYPRTIGAIETRHSTDDRTLRW